MFLDSEDVFETQSGVLHVGLGSIRFAGGLRS